MKVLKTAAPLALALLTTACIGLDGAAIGSYESGPSKHPRATFQCENGYRVLVNYRGADGIMLAFKTGKDTFVIGADEKPAASGRLFVAKTGTVKWHETAGGGVLTYPDSQYRTTKKLWDTACKKV